jgi:hypothetical protein
MDSTIPMGWQGWLRQLPRAATAGAAGSGDRLLEVKRLIGEHLGQQVAGMSHRDVRVYLKLLSAQDLATLRSMRFDYFDLLCRYHGELLARRKLEEIRELAD